MSPRSRRLLAGAAVGFLVGGLIGEFGEWQRGVGGMSGLAVGLLTAISVRDRVDSIWTRLPPEYSTPGEVVLWEGRASVQTAAIVGDEVAALDTAGGDIGFAVLTDQRLVIGHLSEQVPSRPEVWNSFALADVAPDLSHPHAVAFSVDRFGPVDVVVIVPGARAASLRAAVTSLAR